MVCASMNPRSALPILALLLTSWSAVAQIGKEKVESVSTLNAAGLRAAGKGFVESITIHVPPPVTTLEEFTTINQALPSVLPDLGEMLKTAIVSPFYADLYRRKLAYLKDGNSLTDHNYLDCATALQIQHPRSGRRCLLVQSDMDVVTDGSDPDRAPELADYNEARGSDWYLPQTAYQWADEPRVPNPFLTYYPQAVARLDHYRTLFEKEALTDKGRIWRLLISAVDSQKARMRTEGLGESTIRGLKNSRSLLAAEDPFVVLPSNWFSGPAPWTSKVGDYAAVIHGSTIYPALLGEAGPTFKTGEASLRLARAINPKSSGRVRAVSDLGVTYLVFPGTAGPRKAPDLALWQTKVREYLSEIGADTGRLHSWVPES